MSEISEQVQELLNNPEKILQKKPFFRGYDTSCVCNNILNNYLKRAGFTDMVSVTLPQLKKRVITQDEYLMELEPENHKVLYDQNIPSITMKLDNGGFVEVQYKKMAVSFQQNIKDKQVQHLCGLPMSFTLMDANPDEKQRADFVTFKQYWDLRNQDGMKTKMVDVQKSVGDVGLLYYFDKNNRIKSRILSYMDGYVLCPHDDDNGDRILESVYYKIDDVEYIDSYDDTYFYRMIRDNTNVDDNGWRRLAPKAHGFTEIPLITKRGKVAWENAQSVIEAYEILYNIFLVIQKRHGWGILYIKGDFENNGKKIAGSVILNSKNTSYSQEANTDDAKFLTPPSPQGTIDTLQLMEETIQKNSSTTFLLPKDVKTTGDISGVAIMLTQSMDIENASKGVIEWQNVADKMVRLFKQGLAKELVASQIQPSAITDFDNLHINAKFKVYRPQSETDIVTRLQTGVTSGFLSVETASEMNPDAKPDEKARLEKEKQAKIDEQLYQQEQALIISQKHSEQGNNNNNKKEE